MVKKEVSVFFRNDVDKIERSYSSNDAALMELDSIFAAINRDSTLTLDKVELAGWASPPATARYNVDLSHRRANAIKEWLSANDMVTVDSMYITYNGVNYRLLGYMVAERGYRYADDVLQIINDEPASVDADYRQMRLRRLHNGVVWRELTKDYFPEMRRTDVVIYYDYIQPAVVPDILIVEETHQDEPILPVEEPEPIESIPDVKELPNRYWSLHTNLLFQALMVPNIGAELYLGKNISISTNWRYAWWNKDKTNYYYRTYGLDLSVRKWFGKAAAEKPLTGHHVALYGELMLYDFEFGNVGYLSGTPGKNIFHHPTKIIGIGYGFALPIKERLNLDFSIGIGYLTGRYWKYKPGSTTHSYRWFAMSNRKYFGPTKVEVSLVYLLGHGNRNKKKGGAI